jgi:predicted TIM-barrel fold metal-dependent hydrolase
LGLEYRDPAGELVLPDDPRLSDLWDAAGKLGVPALIHTADPTAFFKPLDRHSERWDELGAHPDWHFCGAAYPPFQQLIDALYQLIERHPRTNFITAHVGCYPENLGFVSDMLERYPNCYTDISARIAELGRAPYSARQWFLRYANRILFGTDFRPRAGMYRVHWRFLETADEYFAYDAPPDGDGQLATDAPPVGENSDGLSVDFSGHWSPIPTQGR